MLPIQRGMKLRPLGSFERGSLSLSPVAMVTPATRRRLRVDVRADGDEDGHGGLSGAHPSLSWFRGPRQSSRVPPAQGPQGRLGFSINDKMSGNRFYRVQLTERGDVPSCGTWTHSSRRTWGQGWGWRGPRGWKVRSLSGATQTRLSYEAEERRVACMPRGGSHVAFLPRGLSKAGPPGPFL